jgi:GxxExxY protein
VPNDHRDDPRDNHHPRGNNARGGRPPERRGVPLADLDPTTTEASRKVIGCSIEVHRTLGPGYDAPMYAKALKRELGSQGVRFECDKPFAVKYKDEVVGEVCTELLVEDLFLVKITARPGQVGTFERLELRSQLKAANLDLGLIINFAERRLKDGLVRVLNMDKLKPILGYEDDGHDSSSGQINEFDIGR